MLTGACGWSKFAGSVGAVSITEESEDSSHISRLYCPLKSPGKIAAPVLSARDAAASRDALVRNISKNGDLEELRHDCTFDHAIVPALMGKNLDGIAVPKSRDELQESERLTARSYDAVSSVLDHVSNPAFVSTKSLDSFHTPKRSLSAAESEVFFSTESLPVVSLPLLQTVPPDRSDTASVSATRPTALNLPAHPTLAPPPPPPPPPVPTSAFLASADTRDANHCLPHHTGKAFFRFRTFPVLILAELQLGSRVSLSLAAQRNSR